MSTNVLSLHAGDPAGRALRLSPDVQVQGRLAVLVVLNLIAVAASFFVEDALLPWKARMDSTSPGWCFVLAQASTLGLSIAIATRGGSCAVAAAVLVATLLGYAYVLAGVTLIDPRRALQSAHLIFRAVELGLVSVAALSLGVVVRLMLTQRLAFPGSKTGRAERQYHLGELMFLMVVFAVGLGLANLFFDHFDRETQLADVVLAIARSFPAALPWLWLLTQPKLKWTTLALVAGSSVGLMLLKAEIAYSLTGDEFATILVQAGYRAAAYTMAATLNGLALRGFGLRWLPA